MDARLRRTALMLALGAVGCSEPLIGSWQGEERNACGQYDDFSVDDELTGSGSLWLPTSAGECTECSFELEMEAKGKGTYEGALDSANCACDGVTTADVRCTLKDDELDCAIDWRGPNGPCLQGSQTFLRDD
jgi:hypothetical protein